MGIRLAVAATDEPITLNELKASLRVTHDREDAVLMRHLAEAREFIEQRCQHQLSPKTWELTIDWFPPYEIMLAQFPVLNVESIKYDDAEGFEQTVAAADYYLDKASDPCWVFPVTEWPATLDAINAVRVRYVSGYEDYTLIPGALKSAIILKVQELYDGTDTARAVHNLLMNYYLMVA